MFDKQDIYDLLNEKGIWYEVTEHPAVFNMEELEAIELPYPDADAKNLFIRDDKRRNYYLITVKGDQRADLKQFRKRFETRPLSFVQPDELMSILGLIPGAVTPFGILNNEEKDVVVFIDKDYENKLMGIHPCDNTATVYVNCRDVAKLIKEHGNELHFVKM